VWLGTVVGLAYYGVGIYGVYGENNLKAFAIYLCIVIVCSWAHWIYRRFNWADRFMSYRIRHLRLSFRDIVGKATFSVFAFHKKYRFRVPLILTLVLIPIVRWLLILNGS
jgi:hypothetical protein